MTSDGPKFLVGKAFPAGDKKAVACVRFLTASQSLASLARLPKILPDSPAGNEAGQFVMVLSFGAAHEAAITFREADAIAAFAELEMVASQELKNRLARLRAESNLKDPTSLRSLIIKFTRNKISFHWDAGVVKAAIADLSNAELHAWKGGKDKSVAETSIPLVSAVIDSALSSQAGSQAALGALASKVATFQGDCFHLAHATFGLALRKATRQAGPGAV